MQVSPVSGLTRIKYEIIINRESTQRHWMSISRYRINPAFLDVYLMNRINPAYPGCLPQYGESTQHFWMSISSSGSTQHTLDVYHKYRINPALPGCLPQYGESTQHFWLSISITIQYREYNSPLVLPLWSRELYMPYYNI